MAALEELERAYDKAQARSEVPEARLTCLLRTFCRASHAAVFRPAPDGKTRRREDLSEARRPAAYRRAQDQQLPRAGAAGASAWASIA